MKAYLFIAAICISISLVHAQVSKTIILNTPGTLESLLSPTELNSNTSLVVQGKINELDFLTMRVKMPSLVSVDISETDVMESTRNGYTYPANEIPKYALADNIKIKTIKLPSSANSIGVGAFRGCSGLSSFANAVSVTTIKHEAFYACKSLKTVEIPAKVSTIQYEAFYFCDSLTSVNISSSLVSFERNCFNPTAGFTVDPKNLYFSALDGILYNKNKTSLLQCPNSKSGGFSIVPTVVTIGADAFRQCGKITGITFSPVLDSIKDYAFIGCTGLTELNFPSSLKYIGNNTFFYCTSLKSVELSNSLEIIGDNAFERCPIDSVAIPSMVKRIGSLAFRHCTSLKTVSFFPPSALDEIGLLAFNDCSALITLNIPNSVKKIGGGAFVDCINLKEVKLPSSITSISISLFQGCEKLTKITIPNYVTKIDESAFLGCYALSSIFLPTGVDTIGVRAFGGCIKLKYTNIPASVKFIGAEAYLNCKALSVLYVYPQTPVDLSLSEKVFDFVPKSTCRLMIPSASKSTYATANRWKDFTWVGDIDVLLSEIKYNGIDVPTFHNMIFDYSIIFPPGTSVPVITAKSLYPNATVKITQSTSLPGTASIEVTGLNKTTKQTHTVYLAFADESSNIVTMNSGVKTRDKIWMIVNGTPGQAMVDYGDGNLVATTMSSYTVYTPTFAYLDAISPVDNPVIKIYAKSISLLMPTAFSKLTALDVSKDTSLFSLSCSDNQLTTLDVSKNTSLIRLECNNNKLTSIKCSTENTALNEIYSTGNQLSECGLEYLFKSLPVKSNEKKGTLTILNNPGAATSNTQRAIDKFWTTDLTGSGAGCTFSPVATLSSVNVNGTGLATFNPAVFTYNLLSPGGTAIPIITVTPTDANSSVKIIQATTLPVSATVEITAQDGINKLIYTFNFSINTGIGNAALAGFEVFPNPGSGKFKLRVPEGQQLDSFSVINSSGQIVRTTNVSGRDSGFSFDLSDQPNGIYILRFSTSKGLVCRKLVKR
jgi:hypothetical protein